VDSDSAESLQIHPRKSPIGTSVCARHGSIRDVIHLTVLQARPIGAGARRQMPTGSRGHDSCGSVARASSAVRGRRKVPSCDLRRLGVKRRLTAGMLTDRQLMDR